MRTGPLQGLQGGKGWMSLVVAVWLTGLGGSLAKPQPALAGEDGALGVLGYTGRLRLDGALYSGEGLWRFAIVDAAGKILWTNDGSLVLPPASGVVRKVSGGVMGIALGRAEVKGEAMQPIPSGIFSAPQTYLRAWVAVPTTAQPEELVASETPVSHAQAFTSVPYSHRAAHAARADQATTASVANALAPSVAGQPVEVAGDLVVKGRIVESGGVGAASSVPAGQADGGQGHQGRVTFNTVTTRALTVTEDAWVQGELKVGRGTIVINSANNLIEFRASGRTSGAGTIRTTDGQPLTLDAASVIIPGGVLTSTVTQIQTLVKLSSGLVVGADSVVIEGAAGANNILFTGGGGVVRTDAGNTLHLSAAGDPASEFSRIRLVGTSLLQNRTVGVEGMTVIQERLAIGAGFPIPFPLGGSPDARLQVRGDQGTGLDVLRVEGLLGSQVIPFLKVDSGGRVGVGTVSPGARLDVQQPGTTGLLLRAASGSPLVDRFTVDGLGNAAVGGNLTVNGLLSATDLAVNGMFRVNNGVNDLGGTSRLLLDNESTLLQAHAPGGISSLEWKLRLDPVTDRLVVQRGTAIGGFVTLLNLTGSGDFGIGPNATLNVRDAQRRVGINVVQPAEMLHVAFGNVLVEQANALPAVVRLTTRNDGTVTGAYRQEVRTDGSWVVRDELAAQDRLMVDAAGDLRASGHIYAHGTVHIDTVLGDVAERFETIAALSVGEAVVPSPAGDGKLMRSTNPRDPGFIGVVSEGTGLVLAEKRNGPPIAITGRVRALLSVENGPITPGSPLTTASTPGHLMKADKSTPGNACVGVALGSLSSGSGLVEIVLR